MAISRRFVLALVLAAQPACLVEYVLPTTTADTTRPDGTRGDAETAATAAGDPTGETAATGQPDPTAAPEDCEPPRVLCGDECVDLFTDPQHCGECGEVCGDMQLCLAADCQSYVDTTCEACPCEACGDGSQCCEQAGAGEAGEAGEAGVFCLLTDDAPCPEGQ